MNPEEVPREVRTGAKTLWATARLQSRRVKILLVFNTTLLTIPRSQETLHHPSLPSLERPAMISQLPHSSGGF